MLSTKIQRAKQKWPALKRQVGPWLLGFLINLVLAGWAYALVEGVGPVEGPWWGVVTASTTGYGDLYPKSTPGRGIAAYLILSSIIIDRIMSAKIVAVMVEEPHLYSDAEQKCESAKTDLMLSLLLKAAEEGGTNVASLTEYERYRAARAVVAAEKDAG